MSSWIIISINVLVLALILSLLYTVGGVKTDLEDIQDRLERKD